MAMTSEIISTNGQAISWDVYMPKSPGKWPAVLVLHGSFGMRPPYGADIASFAEALADSGFAAILPHYLQATGSDLLSGLEIMKLIPEKRPAWRQACSDALGLMGRDARFDASRLGVLGFSLGANLALSLAMEPPAGTALKFVVDFFGPTEYLGNRWSALPPIRIFHGENDRIVDHKESDKLVEYLVAAKKKKGSDYVYECVEGEGHGFKDPALSKSRVETLAFIQQFL
jgi:dienelactone hydrolase